jgi:hypothetical protein
MAALGLAIVALLAAGPSAVAQPDVAARLTAKFAAMDGAGWTGGDAAWSARLPDGREVWLFGDTFLGGVGADGRRELQTPMVRNSMVVDDGSMSTRLGANASSLVPGGGEDDWYWPGPPVVGRGALQVPIAHIVRTGPGGWDFQVVGTSVAVFALPGLDLRSVTPIATPPGVNMASAAIGTRRFTYVYGTRGALGKDAFVARVPRGDLAQPWSYWTGSSWSADAAAAVPIANGVSDEFSVIRRRHGWLLVSQVPMSRTLVALRAPRPQGPWRPAGRIAEIPPIPHAITYNAIVHPEYSHGRTLLIGYSVNGESEDSVYADAALYRPRFMTVRFGLSRRP